MSVLVTPQEFEALVQAGIEAIPEKFRSQLRNVVIVAEAEPSPENLALAEVPAGETLLGLCEGPSAGEQGSGPWEFPAKISIFQRPSEEMAESVEDLARIVRETVWHEVAHYLGMEEAEVARAEGRRSKND